MLLSMTTDYTTSHGCPEPYLRRIAEAGFTHVHWCHQWNTDFLYGRAEIAQIRRWLDAFHLQLLDLHASRGVEKCWVSTREYARLAGVELVSNRIEMTARLGGAVIILHAGAAEGDEHAAYRDALHASLESLAPVAREHGVRIAIENGDFREIRDILTAYPADYLGLCYDSGHGNDGQGLDELEALKDRLISVHLHDNDGVKDLHRIPFYGTVDWPRLAGILAASSYTQCLSSEANMHQMSFTDEAAYLTEAYSKCCTLAEMVEAARQVRYTP